jgi:hypothetical protein
VYVRVKEGPVYGPCRTILYDNFGYLRVLPKKQHRAASRALPNFLCKKTILSTFCITKKMVFAQKKLSLPSPEFFFPCHRPSFLSVEIKKFPLRTCIF